jgi:gliding motility-associated protein GldM
MEENALFCAHLALRSLKDRKPLQTVQKKEEEKKDTPSAVIVPAERNILYAGIDNPLEVFTLQNGSGALRLDTDNGKMVQKNGKWYLTGARTGKARVTLLDGEKEAGQTEFRIREIPEPEAAIRYTLQGKSYWYKGRTPIRREYLAAMDALEVAYTGENGKIPFTVVHFSTLFIGQDKNVTTLESKGKKFSPQQAEHIRKLNKGDKFYLTSILVKAPDGTTREVQPMDIIII